MVIVAPKTIHTNWGEREIPAHMPEHIPVETMIWTGATTMKEQSKLLGFLMFDSEIPTLKILCINIDALAHKRGWTYINKLLSHYPRSLLVVDESTRIKNRKAQRSKRVHELSKKCPYRRILTGTPVTQSPLDLWSQMECLSPKIIGFRSYYAFAHHYAIFEKHTGMHTSESGTKKYEYEIVKAYRNIDELKKKIEKHS